MVDKKQKIYRKKPVTTLANFGFQLRPAEPEGPHPEITGIVQTSPENVRGRIEVQREADRLLLSRYAPPAVVISDKLEILQSRGHTSSFLELPSGKASLNLLKMAREGLLYYLQNAIEEAQQKGSEVVREDVGVYGNGPQRKVTLRVVPFTVPFHEEHSFLVIFEANHAHADGEVVLLPPEPSAEPEMLEKDKQITRLRQELAVTKEHLQSIIEAQEATNEELQSANEEIQSGNEELQSTNEDLQTSKEELESASEELHTVNEEMQHRNQLLTELNNDLTNLLNTVNLPLVLLGSDLGVRRFTPQAADIMGVMGSDIGRPIFRLKLKVHVGDLEEEMLQVMRDMQPRRKRVQDNDGRSYTVNISPYRTMDNHIDGVVLRVESFGGNAPHVEVADDDDRASVEPVVPGNGGASSVRRDTADLQFSPRPRSVGAKSAANRKPAGKKK